MVLMPVPATEEPITEHPIVLNVSSTIGFILPAPPLPPSEQIKPSRNPDQRPLSINDVSRNSLRDWCCHRNLSMDGKNVEVELFIF